MMPNIYFSKVNPNAIIPNKKQEDAGYDFYACFEENFLTIQPQEIAIIPTGIATAFPNQYVLFMKERSSTGAIGLSTRMGIIDSGYRGEIFIGINNTSNKKITISKDVEKTRKEEKQIIYPYTKAIAQGIYLELPKFEVIELPYEELIQMKSDRMFKKLGESGK